MRLPKNFGISQKWKVKSWTLSTSESRPKLSRLFFTFGFRKILTETTEIIENFDKCWKYTGIFENRWYMSKIGSKNTTKWPKFDQKWQKFDQKLYRNIWLLTKTGRLSAFRLLPKMYGNIWLSIINFPGTFSQNYLKNQNPYRNAWA